MKNENSQPIVKKYNCLEEICTRLNYFLNYDLELNLMSMQIGIKPDAKDELLETIQNSYFVDVNFLNVEKDEPPKLKDILQKDKFWGCLCGQLVRKRIFYDRKIQ